MEDISRPGSDQYLDSTRWMLVVLVAVSVLAAGVLAVANVPDLVGNRWQVVGAASAALTVVSLLVAVFVVLRALDPIAEDEPSEALVAVPVGAGPAESDPVDLDGGETPGSSEVPDSGDGGAAVEVAEVVIVPEPLEGPSRRVQRQAVTRHRRARSTVGVAVVSAFVGMAGMTVAAVADGNNVESRARRALAAELALDEEGPIAEPQAVAVQLTTPGLRRVAEAMGCTGQEIGTRPVQGWAVSGTYRNPVVVMFGPTPACKNVQLAMAPRDGFVYPALGVAGTTPTTRPATPPTTPPTTPATTAPAAVTPTTAAAP